MWPYVTFNYTTWKKQLLSMYTKCLFEMGCVQSLFCGFFYVLYVHNTVTRGLFYSILYANKLFYVTISMLVNFLIYHKIYNNKKCSRSVFLITYFSWTPSWPTSQGLCRMSCWACRPSVWTQGVGKLPGPPWCCILGKELPFSCSGSWRSLRPSPWNQMSQGLKLL